MIYKILISSVLKHITRSYFVLLRSLNRAKQIDAEDADVVRALAELKKAKGEGDEEDETDDSAKEKTDEEVKEIALAMNKAIDLAEKGLLVEARAAFEKVTERDGENGKAWENQGVCLLRMGLLRESRKAFQAAKKFTKEPDENFAVRFCA